MIQGESGTRRRAELLDEAETNKRELDYPAIGVIDGWQAR